MSILQKIRWSKVVLTVSLALNLLVAGLVFGAVSGREETRNALPGGQDRSKISLIAVMPRDHRDAVRSALKSAGQEGRDGRVQETTDQADLAALLRQPELDPAEIAALLKAQRLSRMEGAEVFEAIIAREIAGMSIETRAEYAKRLERARRWDRDGWHGKPKKDRYR